MLAGPHPRSLSRGDFAPRSGRRRLAVAVWKSRSGSSLLTETAVVLTLWTLLGVVVPDLFFTTYLPGWALGLGLCFLQGHFEHARGTTSHYGGLYNVCFFNDGYHVEHHLRPGEH